MRRQKTYGGYVRRGLPWAVVIGKHAEECPAGRADLMAAQRALPGCLSQAGPEGIGRVGNYTYRLVSACGDRAVATLYFLDSPAYADEGRRRYAPLAPAQIELCLRTAQAVGSENGGRREAHHNGRHPAALSSSPQS